LPPHGPAPSPDPGDFTRSFLGVFRFSGRALELVWSTSRPLTLWLGLLTLVGGLLPAGIAWVGALIVDAVVAGGPRWGRPPPTPRRAARCRWPASSG
jgi:ATP-binding cassette, subfamily B, bacterial